MLQPEQVIDDRYRVENIIGGGATADIYEVRHLLLHSVHAMKVPHSSTSEMVRNTLLLEGRIQATLRHRNVVRVTDSTFSLRFEEISEIDRDRLIKRLN